MCGIVGIINKNNTDVAEADIRSMCATIVHRGPNDEGTYTNKNVGLGMRRLNIIDLNTGHQPIHNEDKSLWIVFNGEIFNYQELRTYLIKKGHVFYTDTDTEVIIHMYEEEGERCLERFRGMFAFAIYNEKNRTTFIARDRMGIKPLFYYESNDHIYFASEMKAILIFGNVERDIDWKAFDSFFTLSYIPSPMSIFRSIRKLDPGHHMTIKNGTITVAKYWDVRFQPDLEKNEQYFTSRFLELFDESVQMRLISDVPLGAFLSGGIDSSAVVAMMSKHHSSVKTLSIGFGGQIGAYDDERKYARLVSQRYGTDHREYEVNGNECNSALIEKIVQAFDEPFGDHGAIPMYFVCKMARENMTVALSGLGGDELFAGYRRHYGFYLGQLYNAVPASFRRTLLPWLVEKFPESKGGGSNVNLMKRFIRGGKLTAEKRYLTYVDLLSGHSKAELFTDDVRTRIGDQHYQDDFYSYFRSGNATDPLNKVYYTDIKTYLPDDILALTDRISMMHSLEVRVPFLDHKLVEFCATIPPRLKMKHLRQKYLLKKAMTDLLPTEVLTHKKQGFVAPMNVWLNHQLKEYAHAVLLENKSDFFNRESVATILKQHYNGEQLNTSLIWSLLVFTLWHKSIHAVK